ncbi:MAG: hypothetical protein J7621_05025 [Niastella sp.]|nr:hypothetical protein [Niastella sp.]
MATTVSSKGISPERIKNDPAFERTRENMAEFTRAGKAAKFMRIIFRELMINAKDKITQARLLKVFTRVMATDLTSGRGDRLISKGEVTQIQGFNFNERAGFRDLFYRHYSAQFNRTTGQVTVNIPGYRPKVMVEGPKGCTHYTFSLAAATVDFDREIFEYVSQFTPEMAWDDNPVAATALNVTLPANSTQTVLVALGIEFFQIRGGRYYVLKSGEHNAATIALVDPAPPATEI